MAQLAKIETAKMPAQAIAGVKTQVNPNVVALHIDDTSYQRLGVWVLILVFGVFALWTAFAPLGSHVVATGKVVVEMKKQVIQHREGGVIQDIFVEDGDYVKQGQALLVVSPTEAQADKGMVEEQLLSAWGLEARLNAELEGHKAPDFQSGLTTSKDPRAQEIMKDERQHFNVRNGAVKSEAAVLEQRIQQLREQIQGADQQVVSQRELAASYANEVTELKSLFERQLISKLQLDATQREYLKVKTGIAELESNKASLNVQIIETEEQLILQKNNQRKDISVQLSEVRTRIADLRNRLNAVTDRLDRTVIAAPADGTIVGLEYHTKGGVIQPGGRILDIVPKVKGFEVEAQVNISDIDRIYAGQTVDIRFPAFTSASFMKVTPGELKHISADTFVDQVTGVQHYRVRVQIMPKGVADLEQEKLLLVQGMPAEVSIKTGERTFLDYLLKPVSSMMNHALNEE